MMRKYHAVNIWQTLRLTLALLLTGGALVLLAQATGAAATAAAQKAQQPSQADLQQPVQQTLASARTLYVDSGTVWVKTATLKDALLNKKAFQELGIGITENSATADVMLKVQHAALTTRFTFTLVDRKTQQVLAAGKVSSLFGTAAGKIADSVAKNIKKARAATTQTSPKALP